MPFIQYTDGSGKGVFETFGGFFAQRKQVKDLREICESEGLHKVPLRKRFEDDGIRVAYKHVYDHSLGVDPHHPYRGETLWSGLSIGLDSDSPTEKADNLGKRLKEYAERNWNQE